MKPKDVSRETLDDLEKYEKLIRKWSPSINLIASSTFPDIWDRHIADSMELFPHLSNSVTKIADLGSGGGLPGLVVAILNKHYNPGAEVLLVESDQRKAAFLRTVTIELDLNATIIAERIEQAEPITADVVTARALAPLPKLLGYVDRHLSDSGTALLLKGRGHLEEVAQAKEIWDFDLEIIPNNNTENSAILRFSKLKRRLTDGS